EDLPHGDGDDLAVGVFVRTSSHLQTDRVLEALDGQVQLLPRAIDLAPVFFNGADGGVDVAGFNAVEVSGVPGVEDDFALRSRRLERPTGVSRPSAMGFTMHPNPKKGTVPLRKRDSPLFRVRSGGRPVKRGYN